MPSRPVPGDPGEAHKGGTTGSAGASGDVRFILAHPRGTEPHVRGRWVVDRLRGKGQP
jgi:hypothetical protein